MITPEFAQELVSKSDTELLDWMGVDPARWATALEVAAGRAPADDEARLAWLEEWFTAAIDAGRFAGQVEAL